MAQIVNDARFWDRSARKYAAGPIADMAGYERTLERTRHHLKDGDAVFEFGCGTGTTALRLAPFVQRIVATDISGEMIAIARGKAEAAGCSHVAFKVATPAEMPCPDGTFDVVLGFNVLHLIAAREAALASIHRLLKPGGIFISKTPCLAEMNLFLRLAVPLMQRVGKAPYVSFLSTEELEREIAAAGFEIIEREHHASRGRDARPFLVARKR
ncbi:Methyltransferase type 11 [Bosea sp. LC85]|uniref:class I SAM-dependent methyltransferase n=1 Tax=Bosea sp. LC85 TaxID=1502851 RepID=UPI0004E352DD|nr:class I SAM-dependent methyltransferase [Bosea sp. LC85]KFC64661.1 Methyltransferase type 11 [Bosea sp. LC85]